MQTLAEMAQAVGLPKKPFYTLTEAAKATGIPRSAFCGAVADGTLKSFVPPGRKRGRLTSGEWFAEWVAEGTA